MGRSGALGGFFFICVSSFGLSDLIALKSGSRGDRLALGAEVIFGGIDSDDLIELGFGILDADVARSEIGLSLNEVALCLVETGQLGVSGAVLVIDQITLFAERSRVFS